MQHVRTTLFRSALALLAVLAIGACASGGAADGAAGGAAAAAADGMSVITVQNNHTAARPVTLYLEPDGRAERINLGVVEPGATGTFTHAVDRGYYRIIAGMQTEEVESDRFNVTGPSTLNWVMASNRLTVRRR